MESLCVIWGKSFKGKRELTKHTNNVNDTSEHPCDICGKILIGRLWFKNHKDTHATIEYNLWVFSSKHTAAKTENI